VARKAKLLYQTESLVQQ